MMMSIGEGVKHYMTVLSQPWSLWDVCNMMYVRVYVYSNLQKDRQEHTVLPKMSGELFQPFLGHPIMHMIYFIHM